MWLMSSYRPCHIFKHYILINVRWASKFCMGCSRIYCWRLNAKSWNSLASSIWILPWTTVQTKGARQQRSKNKIEASKAKMKEMYQCTACSSTSLASYVSFRPSIWMAIKSDWKVPWYWHLVSALTSRFVFSTSRETVWVTRAWSLLLKPSTGVRCSGVWM